MKWKTKQLFLILVILHWPFHTLPQAHMCTIESTHTHHMMKLTQLACTTTHLQMQNITEVRTTDVHLPCSMFWRALFSCLADSPWGHPFPSTPDFPLLNSGDYRDWDQGFDLHTAPLNHREKARIFSKGCLCAPIPQENSAKSSMKVSELQSKTVFPWVQEQILYQSLYSFSEKHRWWKIYRCVMYSTCSEHTLPVVSSHIQ